MGADKWNAKWIWAKGTEADNNVYVEARKAFDLQLPLSCAKVRITANQSYLLSINGLVVGRGPSPSDLEWMSYDEYEVSAHLHDGENVIAVLAHNFGTDKIVTGQLQGPGGLICQLDLQEEKGPGETQIRSISTGSDWKCRQSTRWLKGVSRMHFWGGYREMIDLSREDGWEQPGYNDKSWTQAIVVADAEQAESPWPRLLPREIPPLQQTLVRPKTVIAAELYLGSVLTPEAVISEQVEAGQVVTIDASVPGSYPQITYDFGTEIVGYPVLEVDAEEGGVLQLFYGESLELMLTDTFLLRKGSNRLAPLGRRAFRFLKVAAMATPTPIQLRSLQVQFVHYPFKKSGYFSCSDERLNQIWETGRYTTIVNSQNHFEDCPYREGALWVADSVVMAKVVYQTFDDKALIRKSLLQAARIQNEDGSIPGTGPQRNPYMLPDFCAHWLFGVWEYYCHTGDKDFLKEIWPYALKLADWFAAQEDEVSLFANAVREGWWCFIDWTDDIDRQDRVTAISCFYYKLLMNAALMGEQLGESEVAEGFSQKAAKVRSSVRALLRVPGTVVFADCLTSEGLSASVTAQTNFAAAWSGIMEESETFHFVEEYYLKNRLPRIRGAFFYHIVLETLFKYGFADEATIQIRDYWGAMLDRGATTWWETFDPSLPFSTVPSPYMGHTPTYLKDSIPVSFSHGWGASPTYLLTKELLGVDVSEGGIGAASLHPAAVQSVDWAKGVVPTIHGDIHAEWKRMEDGIIRFRAQLPGGMAWTAHNLEELACSEEADRIVITGIIPSALKQAVEAI